MSTYGTALELAREEVTGAYAKLGPDMYPDHDTLWALISERAAKLASDVDSATLADALGVSIRRAQAILASGAVADAHKVGAAWVAPRYAVDEYAARERKPGRPRA